jgi:phosphoribosyl-AMP cyclohydrolase
MSLWEELKKDSNGLVTAVIVDDASGRVLMVAYMNEEAVQKTIETKKTHFYSRSRQKQWLKGESSGHTQEVKSIFTDCDKDVLLIRVKQNVAACHEGYYSCFYRQLEDDGKTWKIIDEKVFEPGKVY